MSTQATASDLRAALAISPDQLSRMLTGGKLPPPAGRAGKGGEMFWHVAALPESALIRNKPVVVRKRVVDLLNRRAAQALAPSALPVAATSDAVPTLPSKTPSTDAALPASVALDIVSEADRRCADARATVLAWIREAATLPGMSQAKAIRQLQEDSRRPNAAELLPPAVARVIEFTNAKPRKGQPARLVERTIKHWVARERRFGWRGLIPGRITPDMTAPAWLAPFLTYRQKPNEIPTAEAYRDFKAAWEAGEWPQLPAFPSEDQVYRALKKLGKVEIHRGRMLSRAIKSVLGFFRRDTSHLLPGEVYVGDGHSFKAEVAHPDHGRPFVPEVTAWIDAASRKLVGWAPSLSEAALPVSDSFRVACVMHGIPLIAYGDNGSGQVNKHLDDPLCGIYPRLDVRHETGIAYNSQARGVIERAWQSTMIPAARRFGTYKRGDKQARQAVFKLTRKEIAETGASRKLPSWQQFIDEVNAQIDAYNDRPHSMLPRIDDPATGKSRHMTPNEYWAEHVGKNDALDKPTAEEARELFRPWREVQAIRCEIRLFGRIYFSRELEELHGEKLIAGYDVADPAHIVVRTLAGAYLCTAELDANKTPFFHRSVLDDQREARFKGRLRRVMNKVEEIEAELAGPALEASAAPVVDISMLLHGDALASAELTRGQAAPPRAEAVPLPEPKQAAPMTRARGCDAQITDLSMFLFGDEIDAEDAAERQAEEEGMTG